MADGENEIAQKTVESIKDGRVLDAKNYIYEEIGSIERSQQSPREKAESEEAFLQSLLAHNKELEQANLPPIAITHQGRDILIGRPPQGTPGEYQNEDTLYGEYSGTAYGLVHRNDANGLLKPMLQGNITEHSLAQATNTNTLRGSESLTHAEPGEAPKAHRETQEPKPPYELAVDQRDGAIVFNQFDNYHGNTENFAGAIRIEHRTANAQLWFPYNQNFWPKPGQEIRVKGNVASDQRGYGDYNQYQLNEFQGSIRLNPKTGQPEFVGTLTDGAKGIGFDVRLPLRGVGKR